MKTRQDWRVYRARVVELEREGTPNQSAKAQAFAELKTREQDRAAKNAAEKSARAKLAMTCQICGRAILADTGLIAHHGYQRPGDGWQTASCYGARELPFEASRDVLGPYVASLLTSAERHAEHAKELRAGTAKVFYEWHEYNRALCRSIPKLVEVTAETFDSVMAGLPYGLKCPKPTFESTLASNIKAQESKERFFRSEHKSQKARYDAWIPTHAWQSGAWRKLA